MRSARHRAGTQTAPPCRNSPAKSKPLRSFAQHFRFAHLAARQIQPSLAPLSENLGSAFTFYSSSFLSLVHRFDRRASAAVSCRSQGTLGRWEAEVPELKRRGDKTMSTFRKHLIVAAIAILTLFFGSAREVGAGVVEASRPANCRNRPVVKNLTGLKGQHVCDGMSASRELTKGEVNSRLPRDRRKITSQSRGSTRLRGTAWTRRLPGTKTLPLTSGKGLSSRT